MTLLNEGDHPAEGGLVGRLRTLVQAGSVGAALWVFRCAVLRFWADGVYFTPRLDEDRQCMLVIIGADEWGNKDVLGLTCGFRESTQSWRELLLDLKRRGLEAAPKLAVGGGAMGF